MNLIWGTFFNISFSRIGDERMVAVSQNIKLNQKIDRINLSSSKISQKGIKSLNICLNNYLL